MSYKEEMYRAMKLLGENPRTFFLGQCVAHSGTTMFHTLRDVPLEKRLELPVFEDTQMGISIGMALAGYIPVSVYPRMDFLLLATNQLVSHLDRFKEMSADQFNPRVIIRSAVGSQVPLMPGPQHSGNYCEALRHMLRNVDVVELKDAGEVVPSYLKALDSERSTVLVEFPDRYDSS